MALPLDSDDDSHEEPEYPPLEQEPEVPKVSKSQVMPGDDGGEGS